MVVRQRDKQFIIRYTADELGIIDNFCSKNGITRSALGYDLVKRIDEGEYIW